jgi:CHAT domain
MQPSVIDTVAADSAAAASPAPISHINVHITLICGGITNVRTPIAIGARYNGLAFADPTAAFDRLLDSWMTRAVDLGIIGSALGLLFPINLQQYHKVGKVKAKILILVGMGEPGPFAHNSLQFIISNVVVAVKAMGQMREQKVNARLLRDSAERMSKDETKDIDHGRLGVYFTETTIPEDFRKLTEGSASVTLEVDETTAVYPWEMIAHKRFAEISFVSLNVAVSRQFRSLLSTPPTSPPPLNNQLRALVIADPAPGLLGLAGARREGLAVVDGLEQARVAWGDRYDIKVKVRIGPGRDEQVERILKFLRSKRCVESAEPCDPLDLAMLIGEEQHDLIHYAGHGLSEPTTGQTGWVFAPDCVLSAKEIFLVRQVPRLVLANSCFSAVTSDYLEMHKHMTGLAQAYFARGIPNFIGAGWTVDDNCAEECAKWFYARLMGLRSPHAPEPDVATTIGEALRAARDHAFQLKPGSSSCGAYQHYGRASDRLIALRGAPQAKNPTRATSMAAPAPTTTVEVPRYAICSFQPRRCASDRQRTERHEQARRRSQPRLCQRHRFRHRELRRPAAVYRCDR